MGRYSPTVVADYGPGLQLGPVFDAFANVLISRRERKRREREDEERRGQREEENKRARRQQAIQAAQYGVFEGEAPTGVENLQLPLPGGAPGVMVPSTVPIDNSRRYRNLGEGLYQDFALSPEGRAIAGDQRDDKRATDAEFARHSREVELATMRTRQGQADATAKAEAEESRRRRVYQTALGLGYSPSEAQALAEFGNADALVRPITARKEAEIKARYDKRGVDAKKDPVIVAEDARRKQFIENNQRKLKFYEDALQGDPEYDAPNIRAMAPLEGRIDSLTATLGTRPGDRGSINRIFPPPPRQNVPPQGAANLPPEQAMQLQREIEEVNALMAQARAEKAPEQEVIQAQQRALQAIYRRYGIRTP